MGVDQSHLYAAGDLVYHRGRRVAILRLLRTLRGRPVYEVAGEKSPIREEELSRER